MRLPSTLGIPLLIPHATLRYQARAALYFVAVNATYHWYYSLANLTSWLAQCQTASTIEELYNRGYYRLAIIASQNRTRSRMSVPRHGTAVAHYYIGDVVMPFDQLLISLRFSPKNKY